MTGILAWLAARLTRIGGAVEPHKLNGRPGAIFRDREGKVLTTWTLDIHADRIHTIHTINNPDKLGHLGPVADTWSALRDSTHPHHPTH